MSCVDFLNAALRNLLGPHTDIKKPFGVQEDRVPIKTVNALVHLPYGTPIYVRPIWPKGVFLGTSQEEPADTLYVHIAFPCSETVVSAPAKAWHTVSHLTRPPLKDCVDALDGANVDALVNCLTHPSLVFRGEGESVGRPWGVRPIFNHARLRKALTSPLRVMAFPYPGLKREKIEKDDLYESEDVHEKFGEFLDAATEKTCWCRFTTYDFMPFPAGENHDLNGGGYALFLVLFDRKQASFEEAKPEDVAAIASVHWNSKQPDAVHLDFICSGVPGAGSLLLRAVETFALNDLKRSVIMLASLLTATEFYSKQGYSVIPGSARMSVLELMQKSLDDETERANTIRDHARAARRNVVTTKWAAAEAAAAEKPPTALVIDERFAAYKVLRPCRPLEDESGKASDGGGGSGGAGAGAGAGAGSGAGAGAGAGAGVVVPPPSRKRPRGDE